MKLNENNNHKNDNRKTYNSPKLTKFGSIVDLTAGTSGTDFDAATSDSTFTN
ncbi:MAG TPA: hypothetical protein VLL52_08400 [Anaerolineae bacterium]|nr:hypothetical protein [Anaerolineae bacterium]